MTREERDRLLALYSSGEIHPLDRERLFTEALRDQELFEELFEEDTLADALADADLRHAVMAEDPPRRAPWHDRWRRAALAAVVASVVLGVVLVRWQIAQPQKPELLARSVPPPVTAIEPLPSPLPQSLEPPSAAPAVQRQDRPQPAAPEPVMMAAPAEVITPAAQTIRDEAPAPRPFTARIELSGPGGKWRAVGQDEVLPAGAALRLSVAASAPVWVTAGGERALVRSGETRGLPLPPLAAGEHEIRVEWTPEGAAQNEVRSRLMSESAGRSRDLLTGAGQSAGSGFYVIRVRVE